MIRTGIVGCGRMGEIHCRILKEIKGVQIVGVADPDVARAHALTARAGTGVAARDLESLVEMARPDAIHILTPPATHAPLACAALGSGCHVFVEKPMALTAHDARLMALAAEDGHRILTVGHNHLFDSVIREARTRMASGRLGQLVGLDAFHGALPGHPAWVTELPSGFWVNDVSHLLYLCQSFMGEFLAIQAIGYPVGEGSKVTELRVIAQHAQGLSSLTLSEAAAPFRHRLTLLGTERTLEVDLIHSTLIEARPFTGHRWLRKGVATLDASSQLLLGACRNAFRVLVGRERGWSRLRALLEAFYAAIRCGDPSPVPVTQGVRVMEIIEDIERLLRASPGTLATGTREFPH